MNENDNQQSEQSYHSENFQEENDEAIEEFDYDFIQNNPQVFQQNRLLNFRQSSGEQINAQLSCVNNPNNNYHQVKK